MTTPTQAPVMSREEWRNLAKNPKVTAERKIFCGAKKMVAGYDLWQYYLPMSNGNDASSKTPR